jgi:hypothetical protein
VPLTKATNKTKPCLTRTLCPAKTLSNEGKKDISSNPYFEMFKHEE